MRFQQDFVERVLEANSLVDIVSQYTQLKPASGGFMGRCPFPDHPEKTPSFSVSEMKQVYNCFGCGKKGNLLTFLRDYNGMGFPEAIEFLALRARIPMPENNENDNSAAALQSQKKKELAKANQLAMQFFIQQFRALPSDHHAKVYAEKRGLSDQIIEEFKIGYAPPEWDGLALYLKSKGVSLPLAEEARLVKARKEGNGHFDLFRDRLMFPILNTMGEPVAFGGRVILQGEPKYLNSPETALFVKGKILYGTAQTAKYIRSQDQVLIVEGYMDLVSLYQAGIPQVVATMGTALTPDHAKILGRMTKNVIALFDGDQAGLTAAERSLPILLAGDLHPKGLVLPDEMDPDDFIRAEGPEALKALLNQAPDLMTLVLGQWMQNYRGEASEKVQLCDRLIPIFESIKDQRLKGLYFREVQTKLSVDEDWLREALGLPQKPHSMGQRAGYTQNAAMPREFFTHQKVVDVPQVEGDIEGVIQLKNAPKAELLLIGLALKNRAHWDLIEQEGAGGFLTHAGVKALLAKATDLTRQGPEKFDKLTGLLTSIVDTPEALIGAGDRPDLGDADEDPVERQQREAVLLRDCLKKVKELFLKAQVEKLQAELKRAPTPELMEQLIKIQRDRMSIK